MRIGIFGGSFDPVHNGHINIAKKAIAELELDKLIVIPANISPFKRTGINSGLNRLLLARVAFNGVDKVEVDDREIKRGGVSYAIDTVRELSSENPGAEFFFIIGEDSVAGLPKWKLYDELTKLVTFKSYPRTPESSTEIRRKLSYNESINDLVPESVALFIKYNVKESGDLKVVNAVRSGLIRKGGYCPCRLAKLPEFFCPCDEFKHQLEDSHYRGLCHCRLYLKT